MATLGYRFTCKSPSNQLFEGKPVVTVSGVSSLDALRSELARELGLSEPLKIEIQRWIELPELPTEREAILRISRGPAPKPPSPPPKPPPAPPDPDDPAPTPAADPAPAAPDPAPLPLPAVPKLRALDSDGAAELAPEREATLHISRGPAALKPPSPPPKPPPAPPDPDHVPAPAPAPAPAAPAPAPPSSPAVPKPCHLDYGSAKVRCQVGEPISGLTPVASRSKQRGATTVPAFGDGITFEIDKPDALDWLSIDKETGALSGTPRQRTSDKGIKVDVVVRYRGNGFTNCPLYFLVLPAPDMQLEVDTAKSNAHALVRDLLRRACASRDIALSETDIDWMKPLATPLDDDGGSSSSGGDYYAFRLLLPLNNAKLKSEGWRSVHVELGVEGAARETITTALVALLTKTARPNTMIETRLGRMSSSNPKSAPCVVMRITAVESERIRRDAKESVTKEAVRQHEARQLTPLQRRRAEAAMKLVEDAFEQVVLPLLREFVKRTLVLFQSEVIDVAAKSVRMDSEIFVRPEVEAYRIAITEHVSAPNWAHVPTRQQDRAIFDCFPPWQRNAALMANFPQVAMIDFELWDGTALNACVQSLQGRFTDEANNIVWKRDGHSLRLVRNGLAHRNLMDVEYERKFEIMREALTVVCPNDATLEEKKDVLEELKGAAIKLRPVAKHSWGNVEQVR